MRNAGALGLALLAVFVAFCFTREPQRRSPSAMRRRPHGEARAREPARGVAPAHLHAGDPSVRH